MNQYTQKHQSDLVAVATFFKKELSSVRTGRANPGIFDGVLVESYGSKAPLQQVGNISVVDAHCMTISPWDKNTLKEIEKAIVAADLGINPVNEGDKIRVILPQPTEADRRQLIKKINEKLETAKVKVRGVRDIIKAAIETAEKSKEIAEDDKFRFLKEMEEVIKKVIEELENLRDTKEEDIMKI